MAVLHSPGILDIYYIYIYSKLGLWSCITELLPDLLSMDIILTLPSRSTEIIISTGQGLHVM